MLHSEQEKRRELNQLTNSIRRQAVNARSTIGEFLTLQQQKGISERKLEKRADMNVEDVDPAMSSCETEDHSFMRHRPGCSQTLPGWSTAKEAVESTYVLSSSLLSFSFPMLGFVDDADERMFHRIHGQGR